MLLGVHICKYIERKRNSINIFPCCSYMNMNIKHMLSPTTAAYKIKSEKLR